MKIIKTTILVAVMASAFSMQAGATTITLAADGQWNIFDVDDLSSSSGGLEWIDIGNGSSIDFKFTLTSSAYLTVVDGAFAGDEFQVFDNGTALGFTSTPTNSYPNSVSTNFDAALSNPNYSKGVFFLAAGQHDITGLLSLSAKDDTNSPFNATVGAVSLTSVPVPAALGFFLVGSGLLGGISRRRSN